MITAILKATISLFLNKKLAKLEKEQRTVSQHQDQTQTHHIDRGSTLNIELTITESPATINGGRWLKRMLLS